MLEELLFFTASALPFLLFSFDVLGKACAQLSLTGLRKDSDTSRG